MTKRSINLQVLEVEAHQTLDHIDRALSLEIVRVTERAAVAAARLRGRIDEDVANTAAVNAALRELNRLPIDGTIVIGEGELDGFRVLYIGEEVGTKRGPPVDVAVDALEGRKLCAMNLPGAVTAMAIALKGTLLRTPDVYMDKIAIGPGYRQGVVDLDRDPAENILSLAKAKGVVPEEITALILDRPRNAELIASVRKIGTTVRLISDGDLLGVIHTADPVNTGVDIYLGIGGAPEGVLAAAALRCIGGEMQGRLVLDTPAKRKRAQMMGIKDFQKKYSIKDMVGEDCLFSATGVTDGPMVRGVRFYGHSLIETDSVLMRSRTRTVRWIRTEHRDLDKFQLDTLAAS